MRRFSDQVLPLLEALPNGVLAVDTAGHIVLVNGPLERMLGYRRDELIGQPVEVLLPPRSRGRHVGMREAFAASPQQRPMGAGRDLMAVRRDGSEVPVEIGLNTVELDEGPCVLAVLIDISERKRSEERQRLLIGELNHRIQNLFTVIQSVAYNSLSGSRPVAEAREVFIDRLHSLGRAYTIMNEQQWRGAPIRQILGAELSAFSDRVALEGIGVMVRQSSAQSFALLVHELTTNAVKYGALSAVAGHISVRWEVDHEARPAAFRFAWDEHGGPPVLPPTRSGYGRKIIEETVRRIGRHQINYAIDGLKYRMEARLDKVGWVIEGDASS